MLFSVLARFLDDFKRIKRTKEDKDCLTLWDMAIQTTVCQMGLSADSEGNGDSHSLTAKITALGSRDYTDIRRIRA
jgi:hypothetical protein